MLHNYKTIIYLSMAILFSACTSYHSPSKLDQILYLIKDNYVEDLNYTQITDDSIHHMLKNLDSHSIYLKQKELEKFLVAVHGDFGGIGISMGIRNKLLTVITPIANTPAKKAGIQSEDVIIKINNHPTLNLSMEHCVALTKGIVGTNLKLTILRKNEQRPLVFDIKRKYINTSPVFSTLINSSILYISIPTFNSKTSLELQHAFNTHTLYKGIILDLRYNPGGLLSEAVSVVDMFIDKGLIVREKGRLNQYTSQEYATNNSIDTSTPIAILINKGSASASEIVSGSLQVHKRAIIVGEKSFGKGSVQTLFPLDNNSALKMTIAKYYLPNEKCIDKIGIKPDFTVTNTLHRKKVSKSIDYKKVKSILTALKKGTLKPKYIKVNTSLSTQKKASNFTPSQIHKDKQLSKAIQILKNNS